MKNYIIMLIVLGFIAFACTNEPIGQQPIDSVPPGPVSNVKIENIPGGAILTYTLPNDEDLLYVKAVYSLKDGVPGEVRASMYTDTLKIAGFGDTQGRQIKLIAVDRSRNESVAVTETITPLEPPVTTIGKALNLVADFGGVHGYWDNPTRAEVQVILLQEDHNKEYVSIETFYSSVVNGEGAKRGMDTIPAKFGIYVQDRWQNRSEIKYFTLTPLYEVKFDRVKFRAISLPNDENHFYSIHTVPQMIDGDYITRMATDGSPYWPQSFTIDLGVAGKLSRMKNYQRSLQEPALFWQWGNIKKFEVWGSEILDMTGNWSSWTKLAVFTSIKPSGLPLGQNTAEDTAVALAGEDFVFPLSNLKVRYVRINVTENWGGDNTFMETSEMEWFGNNR